MQNGMLMKNTPRQLQYSENAPPTNGPSAVPMAANAEDDADRAALARAGERARHDGDRTPERSARRRCPGRSRATISHVSLGAAPQIADMHAEYERDRER